MTDIAARLASIQRTADSLSSVVGNGDAMGERFKDSVFNLCEYDVPAMVQALTNIVDLLNLWDSFVPFDDAEDSQQWYSLGKRHAAASVLAALVEGFEDEK